MLFLSQASSSGLDVFCCCCCCLCKVREAVIDAKEELRQRSEGGGDVFRREDSAMGMSGVFSMVRDKQFLVIQPEPPHRR